MTFATVVERSPTALVAHGRNVNDARRFGELHRHTKQTLPSHAPASAAPRARRPPAPLARRPPAPPARRPPAPLARNIRIYHDIAPPSTTHPGPGAQFENYCGQLPSRFDLLACSGACPDRWPPGGSAAGSIGVC